MDDRFTRKDKPEGQEVQISRDADGSMVLLHRLALDPSSTPEARQSLLEATQATSTFRHSQVLAVREVRLDDGSLVFVQDYPLGPLLADRLKQGGPLPLTQALAWMRQFADALDFAQVSGLTLSQICPTEFVVKEAEGEGASGGLICLCPPVPTGWWLDVEDAAFASPEQKAGQPTDVRSSLYSAGAVLAAMLTSKRPSGERGWINVIASAKLPPPVTRALQAVLEPAIAKRCATPAEWVDLLDQAQATPAAISQASASAPAPRTAPPPAFQALAPSTPQTQSGARSIPLPVLASIVIVLLAFGAWVLLPQKGPSPDLAAITPPPAQKQIQVPAAEPSAPAPAPAPVPTPEPTPAAPVAPPSPEEPKPLPVETKPAVVTAPPASATPSLPPAATTSPAGSPAASAPVPSAPMPAPLAVVPPVPPPPAKIEAKPEPAPTPAPAPVPSPAPAPAPKPVEIAKAVPSTPMPAVVPQAKPTPAPEATPAPTPASPPPVTEAKPKPPATKEELLQQAAQSTGTARNDLYRQVLAMDAHNAKAIHGLVEASLPDLPASGAKRDELKAWATELDSLNDPLGNHTLGTLALQQAADAEPPAAIKILTGATAQLKDSLHAGYNGSYVVMLQAYIDLHNNHIKFHEKPKADRVLKALQDEIARTPKAIPASVPAEFAASIDALLKERAAKAPPKMQEAFLKTVAQNLRSLGTPNKQSRSQAPASTPKKKTKGKK